MEYALSDAGLKWERQKRFEVSFRGRRVGAGVIDLLVEDQVILELKAVECLHPVFFSQLLAYLASSRYEIGLLLNFGYRGKLEYRRCVLTAEHSPR
jgi:GxxExxY protein